MVEWLRPELFFMRDLVRGLITNKRWVLWFPRLIDCLISQGLNYNPYDFSQHLNNLKYMHRRECITPWYPIISRMKDTTNSVVLAEPQG